MNFSKSLAEKREYGNISTPAALGIAVKPEEKDDLIKAMHKKTLRQTKVNKES